MARSRIFNTHLTTAFRLTLTPLRRMLKCRRWVNNHGWRPVDLKILWSFLTRPNALPGFAWSIHHLQAKPFCETCAVIAVETDFWETSRISAEFACRTLPHPEPAAFTIYILNLSLINTQCLENIACIFSSYVTFRSKVLKSFFQGLILW